MSEKADKFRRFAEEASKQADMAKDPAEKERWLKIAEVWLQLAQEDERKL